MSDKGSSKSLQELRAAARHSDSRPGDLDALGVALMERGEYRRSVVCLRAAVALCPNDPLFLHHLASALLGSGGADEAIAHLERAFEIEPSRLESRELLGTIYLDHLNRPDAAFRSFRRAIQLAPGKLQNYQSAARCRLGGSTPQEVIDCLQHSLPDNSDRLSQRRGVGLALAQTGRYEEAVAIFQEIIGRNPDDLVSLHGLAKMYTGLHELDAAARCFNRVIPAAQNDPDINLGYVLHLWRLGDFEAARHFYRSHRHNLPVHFSLARLPRIWEGQDVHGKTVRLIAGDIYFGDAIQFVRFARMAKQAGATVVVEGPKRIRSLLRTVPGVDVALAFHDRIPPFDHAASAFSLLFLLQAPVEEMLGGSPYIQADTGLREKWRIRLRAATGINIGIVWRGSPYNYGNRYACRSMPLEELRPLTRIPGVNVYSLQRGPGHEELSGANPVFPAIDLAPDFQNAAAVVSELDLVVTIDTSIAHLAGALGKLTYVMLPYDTCFRWMMDRADTPWYPAMRLFRQSEPGKWSDVVQAVADAVAGFSHQKAAP
jgi:tetratricopeptide (TPR) repeat protein